MNENSRGRIPVRPLPYSDKDIAKTRELIIEYEGKDIGHLYITDKDDPTVLIDITKLISDTYLSNINGDNTNVTINGEVYNLSELLAQLKLNKISILNEADKTAIPATVHFDSVSVSVRNNIIGVYGFENAAEYSRPVKKDGVLYWESPKDSGDPSEPGPGDADNVISIFPTNHNIILYNKPQMSTRFKEIIHPEYNIIMPFSNPVYSNIKWKLSTTRMPLNILFPGNIFWTDRLPIETLNIGTTCIYEFETWDKGVTWMGSHTYFRNITPNSTDNNVIYLVDADGNKITDEDGNYYTAIEYS